MVGCSGGSNFHGLLGSDCIHVPVNEVGETAW